MADAKYWLKSRTIRWHAFVSAVGAAMTSLSTQLATLTNQLGPSGMPQVWVARVGLGLALMGLIGMWLRSVTTQPLTNQRSKP